MHIIKWLLFCALMTNLSAGFAHEHDSMTPPDSLAISVAFDTSGKLWHVEVKDGFVEVTQSSDLGKTFSQAVRVNREMQKITAHGEIRPKIAVGNKGEIYVAWMQNLKARFSGYIWFARSVDGGKTFENPQIVHQDRAEIGHAFEELVVASNGDITVVWLDARDLVAAKKIGKTHVGSSLYYAISTDHGKTFLPEKKLADNSCECCRIATAVKSDGTVAVMWRHVFAGSERDHAIVELSGKAKPTIVRASYGHWKIDGCPHHGAALAVGEGFGYHMAYFDGAGDKPSLMVSRMDSEAWVSSPPKRFGNMKNNAGHPSLLSSGDNVWLAWRETQENINNIWGMQSTDGGKTWQGAKSIFSTKGKVDYPILLTNKGKTYLAINTLMNGLKLIQLQNE